MNVQGHELGVGFIRQLWHGGTFGELYRAKRQMMEWYVQAQDARS